MHSTEQKAANNLRVLIIDDEPIFLDALTYKFRQEGFTVIPVKNGKEGLDAAQKEHPSVILLDILMPDIGGLEVLAQLKEDPRTRDIPVVLVTVVNEPANIERGLALGAEFYIIKEEKTTDDVVDRVRSVAMLAGNGKRLTRNLVEEHVAIVLMLDIVSKVAEKLRLGAEVRKEHLGKIVEFLRNFADKCHHGKEEGILFPELLKNSANRKLINELLGEHQTGRDYVRGIADSVERYEPGSPDAVHIAVNAEGYVRLLIQHIKKENTALFPIADRELSKQLQKELWERFEELEEEVIGPGKHEEYHGWLKELRAACIENG